MKARKKVISTNELPTKFGWSFWIIAYLILDKMNAGATLWIVAGSVLFLWILLFGFIKGNEQYFSILSLKTNIEKWINNE